MYHLHTGLECKGILSKISVHISQKNRQLQGPIGQRCLRKWSASIVLIEWNMQQSVTKFTLLTVQKVVHVVTTEL